jgi:hypothetical protein
MKEGGAMTNETVALVDKKNREALAVMVQLFERIDREGYKPLHDFGELHYGGGVKNHSREWMERLLSTAANPYAAGSGVVRSVHATTLGTFDVLRHEYRAMGMELVLRESASLMFLEIRSGLEGLLASRPKERIARIEEAAWKLLAMEGTYITIGGIDRSYRWKFQFPPEVVEGSLFTTNPGAQFDFVRSWVDRVDGGILNGRLYFMLSKQREATDGKRVFLAEDHWFDGKCWDPPTSGKYAPWPQNSAGR